MSGELDLTPAQQAMLRAEDDRLERLSPAYRQTVHGLRPARDITRPGTAGTVEWLMAGMDRSPAGKRLYASRDLTRTEFELAVDRHQNGQGWRVSSVLANMLIIDRPTYGECLAHMAMIWANWDSAQAAGELEQGT